MLRNSLILIAKMTLAYVFINTFYFYGTYFFDWPVLRQWYMKLGVGAVSLIITGYLFQTLTQTYQTRHSYLILTTVLALGFLCSTLNTIFLHHYLDPYYKRELADRIIQRQMRAIRQMEKEQNVTFDTSESGEYERLIRQYSLQQLAIDFVVSLPMAFLFAWLIQSFTMSNQPIDDSY